MFLWRWVFFISSSSYSSVLVSADAKRLVTANNLDHIVPSPPLAGLLLLVIYSFTFDLTQTLCCLEQESQDLHYRSIFIQMSYWLRREASFNQIEFNDLKSAIDIIRLRGRAVFTLSFVQWHFFFLAHTIYNYVRFHIFILGGDYSSMDLYWWLPEKEKNV